jgi:hypothetical protein
MSPKGATAPGYVRPCPSQFDGFFDGAVPINGFTYFRLLLPFIEKVKNRINKINMNDFEMIIFRYLNQKLFLMNLQKRSRTFISNNYYGN